jgi:hypothetical protein
MDRLAPILFLLLCGCTQTLDWSELRWAEGDVHVHTSVGSNDTDGDSWPASLAIVARDRGLDFVVLTDHSNAAGSMDCADVEDCPNAGPEFPTAAEAAGLSDDRLVMVTGSEISPIDAGHVGCLPPEGGFTWNGAFVDRPEGEVTAADAVAQCREAGGFSVANHPFSQAQWTAWDWTTASVDGFEVWNGGLRWDGGDQLAVDAWECLVARGQRVVPVAGSDNHRVLIVPPGDLLDPPLGQPRTTVGLLPDVALTWPALRRSLAAGAVVLHEADTFVAAVDLSWKPGSERWTVAGVAPLPARVELRAIALLAEGETCDPSAEAGHLHEVLWSADVEGEFELDTDELEHDRKAPGLRYLALVRDELGPSMEGGVAMTGILETPP